MLKPRGLKILTILCYKISCILTNAVDVHCMICKEALARLHRCAGSSEDMLLAYVISNRISCAGPYTFSIQHIVVSMTWVLTQQNLSSGFPSM